MFHASPHSEQHIVLALDHHRQLIEEAKRYRESQAGRAAQLERPLRWRRLRQLAGDLLINMGTQLQACSAESASEPGAKRTSQGVSRPVSKPVWG